jgi:hypothetical protein
MSTEHQKFVKISVAEQISKQRAFQFDLLKIIENLKSLGLVRIFHPKRAETESRPRQQIPNEPRHKRDRKNSF